MDIERKLQQFLKLISLKDEVGIQKFYMNLYDEILELPDENEYFYKFLMQFINMQENSNCTNKKKEPNTDKNYICIRTLFHRGEIEEFYIDNFYTKKFLKLHPYWLNAMLYYNNLAEAETYIHKYEFKQKSLDCKTKSNHIIVTVPQEQDEAFFKEYWFKKYKEQLEKLNIFPRNVLSTGKEYVFIFELDRSINLKLSSVRYFYETVEKKVCEIFCTKVQDVILLPGSICKNGKIITQKKQPNVFLKKYFLYGEVHELETGFKRCYYQGMPFYDEEATNLSNLGDFFGIQKEDKQEKNLIENKKRYTNVGLQRLQDLDKVLELRNFNLLEERRDYFSILSNICFYLEKDFLEVFQFTKEKNEQLLYPLKEKEIYSIVHFQYEEFLKYKENISKGMKYTNEEIVKKLRITFEEQDKMLQLITKETARLRKNFRDREYSKKYYVKKEKTEKIEKEFPIYEIQNMLELGYSKTEISKRLNVSRNSIKNF